MKFMKWVVRNSGPDEAEVRSLFLIEIRGLFSVVLSKFEGGFEEPFHVHSFNSISWVLSGEFQETYKNGQTNRLPAGNRLIPFRIRQRPFHKVSTKSTARVLTLRGPWSTEIPGEQLTTQKNVDPA
jgi:hypothetical protein